MDDAQSVLDFSALPEISEEEAELAPEERWYAAHMLAREQAFTYVFGECEPPGEILSPSDEQLTTGWPGGGIYQFPPTEKRPGWHYVTHGLSQPFSEDEALRGAEDPEARSGLGLELVIASPEPSVWAPNLLLDLVRYLLFTEDATVFSAWERIPYAGFETLEPPPRLTHLLSVISPEYCSQLRLPGGHCALIHMVGVTDAEIERARASGKTALGSVVLAGVLDELGVGFFTDPGRECATEHPLFDEVWEETERKLREA